MRCKIKQSKDKKEKEHMLIWITKEEREDINIQREIRKIKETNQYQVTTFINGDGDIDKMLQNLLNSFTSKA